jgi:DNA-binding transcriptional regulator GbsR (MarR family)
VAPPSPHDDFDEGDPAAEAADEAVPAAPVSPELEAAREEIADMFGNIAAFWGFTRTQGRIFGVLFLSPEPLGHSEIRARVGASAGSVSMTLASLVHWGVVHRKGRVYAAETDFWKMITGVMRRRERAQIDDAIDRVARVVDRLAALARDRDGTDVPIAFAHARLESLLEFFELGRRFLDAFVARHPVQGLISSIAHKAARFIHGVGAPTG